MSCNQNFAQYTATNLLETSILTTETPLQEGFDINNIYNYRRNKVIIGDADSNFPNGPYTNVPDITINANWPSFQKANNIAIFWNNYSGGSSNRLILYDGENQTGDIVYDSGVIEAMRYKTLFELDWLIDPLIATFDYSDQPLKKFSNWNFKLNDEDSSFLFASAKIVLSNPTNTDGFINIKNIFLGEYFTTENFNFSYGSNWTYNQNTNITLLEDGSNISSSGVDNYEINLPFDNLSLSDRTMLENNLVFTNGTKKPFLLNGFPNSDNQNLSSGHFGLYLIRSPMAFSLNRGMLSQFGLDLIHV